MVRFALSTLPKTVARGLSDNVKCQKHYTDGVMLIWAFGRFMIRRRLYDPANRAHREWRRWPSLVDHRRLRPSWHQLLCTAISLRQPVPTYEIGGVDNEIMHTIAFTLLLY